MQMARGAAWMLLFKLLDRGIGLLSTLILARLLAPDSFGVVAMAMSFIALLELIGAFGFDIALIQRPNATPDHYNTAWTFNLLLGIAIAALMLALAVPIAKFYSEPQLSEVIRVLALGPLLQGMQNIGVVAFRKDLEFHKEFKFLISKRLITFPVTIGLAIVLENHWALVIGIVAGRALQVWISYLVHPYRPRLSLGGASDLLHFSKWLLLLNVLNFLKERGPDFVIGRLGGARSLGLFSVTAELANLPATELVAPINRAVYPAYAKIANDAAALQREYLSVMSMVCLLAVPAVAGVAATAKLLIPVALGPQWLDAIPILQLLAFFGIVQVMQSNVSALCLAVGRANLIAGIQAVHVVLLLALVTVFMKRRGLEGAALAYLVTSVITLPVAFGLILRILKIRYRDFLANLWRPLFAAGCMFAGVTWLIRDVAPVEPLSTIAPWLLGAIGLGALMYVTAIALAWIASGRPAGAEASVLYRVRLWSEALWVRLRRESK